MTTNWRKKLLLHTEWSALQDAFANLQMVTGAPANLAMFVKGQPGNQASEIYITGPGIEVIEAQSPGGWENTGAPSGSDVSLLVGTDDPWSLFGISKAV